MKSSITLCLLAALVSAGSALAGPLADLAKLEQEAHKEREFLRQQEATAKLIDTHEGKLNANLQFIAAQRTFRGDADGALAAFDESRSLAKVRRTQNLDDHDRWADSHAEDALQAIVAAARDRRIVILNEAHHIPVHRAFAMRLARELRKLGFEWLACETFDDNPLPAAYVARATGYYSNEPMFGNFLRDALAQNWRLVPYENIGEESIVGWPQRIEAREAGQARNIVERVLAKDPKARIFIYVGYNHATKLPTSRAGVGKAWMAARLAGLSGFDPLTIDQTELMAHSRRDAEHPLYAAMEQRERRATPFVLRSKNGAFEVFGKYRFGVDIQVVHPRYAIDPDTGRRSWMSALAGLTPVAVDPSLLPAQGERLVAVLPKDAPDDAVPLDILRLEAGQPPHKFMLPPGEYRYSTME